MRISGTTTICAVIGNPVAHSLSPRMHNAAFKAMGLDFSYVAFRVENVEQALIGMRGLGIRGLSVTIPHKLTVMNYLDEIDPLARSIGAVNTVTNDQGRLIGGNTDAYGVLRALETQETPNGKTIVILGAGGAARGAAFALADQRQPECLILAARRLEKAQELALEVSRQSPRLHMQSVRFEERELRNAIENADILVNTTPVGMHPNVDESPIPEDWLHENHLVFDMIYNPLETKLMRDAKRRSARTISGLPMFVHQGAEQFRLWTGLEAPLDVMERAVLESLKSSV